MRGQGAERRLLVLPHEAAVAEDIGTEYRGELTFQYSSQGRWLIPHFRPALRRSARRRSTADRSLSAALSLHPSNEKLGLTRRTVAASARASASRFSSVYA